MRRDQDDRAFPIMSSKSLIFGFRTLIVAFFARYADKMPRNRLQTG